MEQLIRRELRQWQRDPFSYLGLPYHPNCLNSSESLPNNLFASCLPPMQVIGNFSNLKEKLIIVSLEPHFNPKNYFQQRNYIGLDCPLNTSSLSYENYISWQKDYFKVFPTTICPQTTPINYWKYLGYLCSGYAGMNNETEYNHVWEMLSKHCLELPLCPMTAKNHFSYMNEQLIGLFFDRLKVILNNYSGENLKIVTLGRTSGKEIKTLFDHNEEFTETASTILEKPSENSNIYGKKFNKDIPVITYSHNKGFIDWIQLPFPGNGHQYTDKGYYAVGEAISNI